MAFSVAVRDNRSCQETVESGVGHSVVCFRVAVLGSFPVHRYFRNAGPRIQCSLVTAEHQCPEKRLAARGEQQPRKSGRRGQRALICTAWCVEELRVQVGVADRAGRAAALFSIAQVGELRERVGRVRGFWAGLPVTVCGDSRMAADLSQEAAPCWTGVGRGR